MNRKKSTKVIAWGWGLLILLGWGASLVSGWGGSNYNWNTADARAEVDLVRLDGSDDVILNLRLTFDACATCHNSRDNISRHHDLTATAGKKCVDCHQVTDNGSSSYTVQVVRECQACHSISVHDHVQHRIRSCGNCHDSTIIEIHSGWRSLDNDSAAVCSLCHASTTARVRLAIAKGLNGQTVSCIDCHGTNPHTWGDSTYGN